MTTETVNPISRGKLGEKEKEVGEKKDRKIVKETERGEEREREEGSEKES